MNNLDTIKQISIQASQMMLIGMCEYTNYAKVKSYLDKDDFLHEDYKKAFMSIQNIYDNYSYKNIDTSVIDIYAKEKNLDDTSIKLLNATLGLAEKRRCPDFDGTFATFRKNIGFLKMYNQIAESGGFESFMSSLYSESNNSEEVKANFDSLTRKSFRNYKSSSKSVDMGSGMLEYVKTRMFVKDGKTIDFIGLPLIQAFSKGIHVGLTGVLAQSGSGKSQKMDAKLYTSNGEIEMRDVKIGDRIMDNTGNLCNVTGIFPQGVKQVVRVHFDDGAYTDCCEDHLWGVYKTTKNELEVMSVKEMVGCDYTKYRIPVTKPVSFEEKKDTVNAFTVGLLTSDDLFIPRWYKYNSIKNREDVLMGLLDADEKSITTNSERFKNDVVWLCRSLGMIPSVSDNNGCYTINIGNSNPTRYIERIEYLDEYAEMQCISVDSKDHLYLTDDFVVTHNTSITLPLFGISMLENSPTEKVLSIHNEQEEDEIRQLYLMSYITRVAKNKKHKSLHRENFNFMNQGKISQEDMLALETYAIEFEQRYAGRLKFVFVPRFNEDDLEALILEHDRMGYKNIILDTFKTEDSTTGWEGMDNLSKRMDGISKDLSLKIVYTAQLAGAVAWRKYLDVTCIGKAKSLKETATSLYMMRKLSPEEIPTIECSYWVKDAEDKSVWQNGITLDPEKHYYAFFNDKQRKGQDGNVIILQYDLGYLFFKEIGITNSIKNDSGAR